MAGERGVAVQTRLLKPLWLVALAASACALTYGAVTLARWARAPAGMVWVPGGEFTMGTDSKLGWPDEKPAHRVRVNRFWMDKSEVTNAQFRAFADAAGYVTTAEKPPDLAVIMRQSPPDTPTPPKEKLVPGSLVFRPMQAPVGDLRDYANQLQWRHNSRL